MYNPNNPDYYNLITVYNKFFPDDGLSITLYEENPEDWRVKKFNEWRDKETEEYLRLKKEKYFKKGELK